jgi:hypothetical protein
MVESMASQCVAALSGRFPWASALLDEKVIMRSRMLRRPCYRSDVQRDIRADGSQFEEGLGGEDDDFPRLGDQGRARLWLVRFQAAYVARVAPTPGGGSVVFLNMGSTDVSPGSSNIYTSSHSQTSSNRGASELI